MYLGVLRNRCDIPAVWKYEDKRNWIYFTIRISNREADREIAEEIAKNALAERYAGVEFNQDCLEKIQ